MFIGDLLTYKLTIPFLLPNLNDYIKAERTNKFKAAALKRETENAIIIFIKDQLSTISIKEPVTMHYTWFERNRRRDKDNVAFAKKFVQDALVGANVLQNDGWDNITGFTDNFFIDAKNPRVEVLILVENK